MTTKKITEDVRSRALRRVGGELQPSVTKDSDIKGFTLVVTTRRAFWCQIFQPKGINPATGKRRGGGVRHELGDAISTSIADARSGALKAKAIVRQGGDPHREAMSSRALAIARREILPTRVSEVLDVYEKALMARRDPSEATRKQSVAYARKAIRLMNANLLALHAIDTSAVRIWSRPCPVQTASGGTFSALSTAFCRGA